METNPRNETAKFYVVEDDVSRVESTLNKMNHPDHFFEDISTLYQRQTALFQRSCEQLKDLYQIQGYQANTGKSFSEAQILASTNPQYDKRLFMELP